MKKIQLFWMALYTIIPSLLIIDFIYSNVLKLPTENNFFILVPTFFVLSSMLVMVYKISNIENGHKLFRVFLFETSIEIKIKTIFFVRLFLSVMVSALGPVFGLLFVFEGGFYMGYLGVPIGLLGAFYLQKIPVDAVNYAAKIDSLEK